MSACLSTDEDVLEDDVKYGIADCRKRVRSQRATLRNQHPNPIDVASVEKARGFQSYAEVLATVSKNQSSLSRLMECLPGSRDPGKAKHIAEERK